MDIEAARASYAAHSGDERYVFDASGIAQISDAFNAGDDAVRAQIWEVFAAFAHDGDAVEARMAENFFANKPPPEATYAVFVAALATAASPRRMALERILGESRARLSAADRQTLTALFVADPVAHFPLAGSLVKAEPRGPAWDAYVSALARLQEPALLAYGFEAACLAMREGDYFAAFAGRPQELVDAVAERLPSGEGDRLKAALRAP